MQTANLCCTQRYADQLMMQLLGGRTGLAQASHGGGGVVDHIGCNTTVMITTIDEQIVTVCLQGGRAR